MVTVATTMRHDGSEFNTHNGFSDLTDSKNDGLQGDR